MRDLRKIKEVSSVVREVEEGSARMVGGDLRLGKHEPWKLWRQILRLLGNRGSPYFTHSSESYVICIITQFSAN